MKISKLQISAEDWLTQQLGATDRYLLYSELFRAEIWARRVCSKQSLKAYLARSFAEFIDFNPPFENCIAQSLQYKEISQGSGGILAATPLRLIPRADGQYFFLGGPESRELKTKWGVEFSRYVPLRLGKINAKLLASLKGWGAAVISAELWAGLELQPPLKNVLQILEQELAGQPGQKWPELQRWQTYLPTKDKSQRESWYYLEQGRLWRSWHPYGYWFYAWTNGESPQNTTGMRLSREQALRASFALDFETEIPQSLFFSRGKGAIFVSLSLLLPASEYRYFSLFASTGVSGDTPQYHVSLEDWPAVKECLEHRLGVRCIERNGHETRNT